jgi:hypothetical protein
MVDKHGRLTTARTSVFLDAKKMVVSRHGFLDKREFLRRFCKQTHIGQETSDGAYTGAGGFAKSFR